MDEHDHDAALSELIHGLADELADVALPCIKVHEGGTEIDWIPIARWVHRKSLQTCGITLANLVHTQRRLAVAEGQLRELGAALESVWPVDALTPQQLHDHLNTLFRQLNVTTTTINALVGEINRRCLLADAAAAADAPPESGEMIVISTEAQYRRYLLEVRSLVGANPPADSAPGRRLTKVSRAVAAWEKEHYPLPSNDG